MKFVLEKIKKGNWYRQGGAIVAFFINDPYLCMYDEIGHHNVFALQNGNWNMAYFEKLTEKENAEKYLKSYLADNNFIKERVVKWKAIAKEQQAKLKEILKLALNEDAKLKKLVQEYFKLCVGSWRITMVIEVFDPWGKHYIDEYSAKYNLTDDEIAVLTAQTNLTFLQKEMLDRFEIAKSKDLNKINEHYKKYYWYQISWQHSTVVDEEHFENLIMENIRNLPKFEKEIDNIKNMHEENRKNKESIIKIHQIDEQTQKIFRFFSELNDWRDIRKEECVCKINYDLWLFLNKLAKHNKLGIKTIEHAAMHEIEGFTLPEKYVEELKTRQLGKYVMYYNEKDKLSWAYGKDAETIFELFDKVFVERVKEIKGRPAYKGKAKGKVKVINSIKEFSKMREGDILVSIMTRPEMVPVMRKAAAIVTDEGGMTCHAAIVARELKKPCIVGTQVATSSLKDGQEVEVDAEKGIVKILKE